MFTKISPFYSFWLCLEQTLFFIIIIGVIARINIEKCGTNFDISNFCFSFCV